MTIHDEVAALRNQAINLLLNEREKIDADLEQLGHNAEIKNPAKRRGRPPKTQEQTPEKLGDHFDTTESPCP